MKNKLYSISWLLALLAMVSLGFTACSEDDDDNPTLDLSHVSEGFVLNTPANASYNTYDLANASTLELTCSQPNYGTWDGEIIPYAVRYYVQISLDSDFSDYVELATSYTTTDMLVDASELNAAVVELWQNANPNEDYVSEVRTTYIRLRAMIDNSDLGETYSNIISISAIATYQAPAAELPTEMYVCGASIQTAWTDWKACAPVYGFDGEFYTIIYSDANSGFKWGTYEQQWNGYSAFNTINDNAGAGVSEDGDGNIVIEKAGWYTLYIVVEVVGTSNLSYTLNINEAEAGVIGNAWDGASWSEGTLLTPPSDKTGLWESPAADGTGELRAYVKVGTYDWWRTEYTLYNGDLYWRTTNIVDSWSEVGDDYKVTVTAGQKLYVDFDANTGEVK